jgi:hypothetical protein
VGDNRARKLLQNSWGFITNQPTTHHQSVLLTLGQPAGCFTKSFVFCTEQTWRKTNIFQMCGVIISLSACVQYTWRCKRVLFRSLSLSRPSAPAPTKGVGVLCARWHVELVREQAQKHKGKTHLSPYTHILLLFFILYTGCAEILFLNLRMLGKYCGLGGSWALKVFGRNLLAAPAPPTPPHTSQVIPALVLRKLSPSSLQPLKKCPGLLAACSWCRGA